MFLRRFYSRIILLNTYMLIKSFSISFNNNKNNTYPTYNNHALYFIRISDRLRNIICSCNVNQSKYANYITGDVHAFVRVHIHYNVSLIK